MSRFIVLALMAMVLIATLSACGDNSIDTRVDPQIFPVELTEERISAGQVIYAQYCASCHGPVDGQPLLDGTPPHGDSGHTWHHPDRLLYQWVLDKPPLATVMPAFRGTLSDQEVIQVLAYIKNSWPPEIQARQNEGSVQYEAQVVDLGTE